MPDFQSDQKKCPDNWIDWQLSQINSSDLDRLRRIVRQAVWTINLENFEWWALISFNSPELVA